MVTVLDNLRSAFNVGSIIRTCDAFAIKKIYLCGITPGLKNKKVLKTSLGAENNIVAYEKSSTTKTLKELRGHGYELVGLEISKDSIDIESYRPRKKVALVVGNEVSGLSSEAAEICDRLVKIPMLGTKQSLNVSVAFGVAAYELKINPCNKKR